MVTTTLLAGLLIVKNTCYIAEGGAIATHLVKDVRNTKS